MSWKKGAAAVAIGLVGLLLSIFLAPTVRNFSRLIIPSALVGQVDHLNDADVDAICDEARKLFARIDNLKIPVVASVKTNRFGPLAVYAVDTDHVGLTLHFDESMFGPRVFVLRRGTNLEVGVGVHGDVKWLR